MTRIVVPLVALAAFAASPAKAHSPVDHVKRIARTYALDLSGDSAGAGIGITATCSRGSELNQPDVGPAAQIQVIYFVPQGKTDQCLDQLELVNSMNSLNAFFVAQGLGAMHLDRVSVGGPMDIPFVRGLGNQNAYNGVFDIEDELQSRGYVTGQKHYIVFAADNEGGICGEAEWPGNMAAFFLDSVSGCGVRDFGNGTLAGAGKAEVVSGQEILHNEGVVDLFAPNGCQVSLLHYGHVCTPGGVLVEFGNLDPESADIMFPYATGLKLSQKVLDRNHDDYFNVTAPWQGLITDLDDSPYYG